MILGHQNGNPHVNANYVLVEPVRLRIEGVDEAIALPYLIAESVPHFVQRALCVVRQKGNRTGGGTGNDRTVERALLGRTAPGPISFGRIRRGDAPKILAEFRETRFQ